jgi:hypothetical protein
MHDARDVEDKRLLETGQYKQLLAGYFHPVPTQPVRPEVVAPRLWRRGYSQG